MRFWPADSHVHLVSKIRWESFATTRSNVDRFATDFQVQFFGHGVFTNTVKYTYVVQMLRTTSRRNAVCRYSSTTVIFLHTVARTICIFIHFICIVAIHFCANFFLAVLCFVLCHSNVKAQIPLVFNLLTVLSRQYVCSVLCCM